MSVTETGRASVVVHGGKLKITRFALVTTLTLDVRFAKTNAGVRIAELGVVEGAGKITIAGPQIKKNTFNSTFKFLPATADAKVVESGQAAIAIHSTDSRSTRAFSGVRFATVAQRANFIASARKTTPTSRFTIMLW